MKMLNIPAEHRRLMKDLSITYDLNKLGKIQRKRLANFIRTRNVKGYAAPAKIALEVIDTLGQPRLQVSANFISWANLDDKYMRHLKAAVVTDKLTNPNANQDERYWRSPKRFYQAVEDNVTKAQMYFEVIPTTQKALSNVEFPAVPELEQYAKAIESGELNEIKLDARSMFQY